MERHVRARWRGSHAYALPPTGRMCVRLGAGAASTTRWRYQPVDAAGAGSCQKSRSQIGSFFFSPSRSRFQAFPVLSSPRSPPPTFPPRHRQAGQRPPIPGAGCWAPFAGEGCSAALVSSSSSSPWPPAPLQKHCLTLPKHL